MEIKDIINIEKDTLEKTGESFPKIFITNVDKVEDFDKKALVVLCLNFSNKQEKEKMREKAMELIANSDVDRYWFSSTAWVSSRDKNEKSLYKSPSRDLNRKEALIIIEFNKHDKNKAFFQEYTHKDGVITYGKEKILGDGDGLQSYWDAWNDTDEIEMDNLIHKQNMEWMKSVLEKIMEKYYDEVVACKTSDEMEVLLEKAKKDIDDIIKKENETLLEDVEETDEN